MYSVMLDSCSHKFITLIIISSLTVSCLSAPGSSRWCGHRLVRALQHVCEGVYRRPFNWPRVCYSCIITLALAQTLLTILHIVNPQRKVITVQWSLVS